MAEALAVIGAITAVAELSKQAASVVEFIKQVRDAPAAARSQAGQIEQFIQLADKIKDNPALEVDAVESALRVCLGQLQQLQAILSKSLDKNGVQKSLYLALKSSEVERLFVQLERSKASLAITMHEIDSTALYNLNGTINEISTQVNEINRKMEDLSLASIQQREEDHWRKIQATLYFPEMNQRQEQISKAHNNTFEWILETDDNQHGFTAWISNEQDIYWISGKPGSGKSTLIKSILQSKNLEKILNRQKAVVCSFFFWNAGSRLQKTLEGALRAVLFQALGQDLSLAPAILESESDLDHTSLHGQKRYSISWSEEKLFTVLTRVLLGGSKVYYLFLDGLDECQGNHLYILDFVIKVSRLDKVKICVSSRSWSIFESRLNAYPHLQLQQLTYRDIKAYVEDKLASDDLTRPLLTTKSLVKTSTGATWETMAESIIRRAEGVFLWVQLVIQDLCEAAWKRETISELRTRLNDVPEELEELMKAILQNKIDKRHRAETKQMFQIMMELDDVSLPVLALGIDSELQETDASVILSTSPAYILDCCRLLKERLQRRTAGCLEIQNLYESDDDSNIEDLYKSRIRFMHRSAYDLIKDLQAIPGWGPLEKSLSLKSTIFKAHVASLAARTTAEKDSKINLRPYGVSENCKQIFHAASLLPSFSELEKRLFDGSLRIVRNYFPTSPEMTTTAEYIPMIVLFFHNKDDEASSLLPMSTTIQDSIGVATYMGLYNYGLEALSNIHTRKDEMATYLLFIVLQRMIDIIRGLFISGYLWTEQRLPDLLQKLLVCGASPNTPMTVKTFGVQDYSGNVVVPKTTRNETSVDLLLQCLGRYYFGIHKPKDSVMESTLLQILEILGGTLLSDFNQNTTQRIMRFRLVVHQAVAPLYTEVYCVVSVKAEMSCGLLLRECYRKLGHLRDYADLRREHFKVVELRCELHSEQWDRVGERNMFYGTDTYTLSPEESESFTPFHNHFLYGPIEDIHTEIQDLILTILERRNHTIQSAIQEIRMALEKENQSVIQYWNENSSIYHCIEFPW